jgi:ATP-dependent DNA ligase
MAALAASSPTVVAQIEFLEWTEADRLRLSKFVGLRKYPGQYADTSGAGGGNSGGPF